jgi:hypothetical protein
VAIGTVIEPVPVTGFAANFSPIPRIAPPPLGNETEGAATWKLCFPLDSDCEFCGEFEDGFELIG